MHWAALLLTWCATAACFKDVPVLDGSNLSPEDLLVRFGRACQPAVFNNVAGVTGFNDTLAMFSPSSCSIWDHPLAHAPVCAALGALVRGEAGQAASSVEYEPCLRPLVSQYGVPSVFAEDVESHVRSEIGEPRWANVYVRSSSPRYGVQASLSAREGQHLWIEVLHGTLELRVTNTDAESNLRAHVKASQVVFVPRGWTLAVKAADAAVFIYDYHVDRSNAQARVRALAGSLSSLISSAVIAFDGHPYEDILAVLWKQTKQFCVLLEDVLGSEEASLSPSAQVQAISRQVHSWAKRAASLLAIVDDAVLVSPFETRMYPDSYVNDVNTVAFAKDVSLRAEVLHRLATFPHYHEMRRYRPTTYIALTTMRAITDFRDPFEAVVSDFYANLRVATTAMREQSTDSARIVVQDLMRGFLQLAMRYSRGDFTAALHNLKSAMGEVGLLEEAVAAMVHYDLPFRLAPSFADYALGDPATDEDPSGIPAGDSPMVWNNALPPALHRTLRSGLASSSVFWRATRYFEGHSTYWHSLSEEPRTSVDQVVRYLLNTRVPERDRHKIVGAEWWAHRRKTPEGAFAAHSLHWDADESARKEENTIVNPLWSSVFYVEGCAGGPTVILNHTTEMGCCISQEGWSVNAMEGRFLLFPGNMLHCVLPGPPLGVLPHQIGCSSDKRLTFMVNFWARECTEQRPGPGLGACERVSHEEHGEWLPAFPLVDAGGFDRNSSRVFPRLVSPAWDPRPTLGLTKPKRLRRPLVCEFHNVSKANCPRRKVSVSLCRGQTHPETAGHPVVSNGDNNGWKVEAIARVDANISTEDFAKRFIATSTPVIIPGSLPLDHFTLDFLDAKCGSGVLETTCLEDSVMSHNAAHFVKIHREELRGQTWAGLEAASLQDEGVSTLHDVIERHRAVERDSSTPQIYLHDNPVSWLCPDALSDIAVPRFFPKDLGARTLAPPPWTVGCGPPFPSLFIGPAGSGSGLHVDAGGRHFWMAIASGTKTWRVFHKDAIEALGSQKAHYGGSPTIFSVNAFEPDFARFPLLRTVTVYEGNVSAGDVIFIPYDTPHQVHNVDRTVAIAYNFVDSIAAPAHLRFVLNRFAYRVEGLQGMCTYKSLPPEACSIVELMAAGTQELLRDVRATDAHGGLPVDARVHTPVEMRRKAAVARALLNNVSELAKIAARVTSMEVNVRGETEFQARVRRLRSNLRDFDKFMRMPEVTMQGTTEAKPYLSFEKFFRDPP